MKVLYIEARKKAKDQTIPAKILNSLPKELYLAYSIQYKPQASEIKKQLESNNTKITGFSQVLGCTKLKTKSPILLIGSGRFHALNLASQSDYPIYIYSNGTIEQIGKSEIESLKKKKQGNLSKFLSAERIGILFSTKLGQYDEKEKEIAFLTKKFPEKKFFFFVSDSINPAEFENFHIDFWLNTACPGLVNDSTKIENIDDICMSLLA